MREIPANLLKLMFSAVFLLLLYFTSQIIVSDEATIVFEAIFVLVMALAMVQMQEEHLTMLIILVLMLGSCYRWDVSAKTFYLRFFVLFMVVLKGVLSIGKKTDSLDRKNARWSFYHSAFLYVSVLGVLSSWYSIDSFLTLQRSISFLLLFLVICFFFWSRVGTPEKIEANITILWKSFCIIILTGCVFFLFIPSQMRVGGRLRLILLNPNQLGHYCAMMSPIVVWYFYEKAVKKWFSMMMIFLMLLCILASGSRASMIATFFSCGTLFFLCYRKKAVYMVGIGIFLLSLHALLKLDVEKPTNDPSYVKQTIFRTYSIETGSGRTGVWKSAWQLIKKQPFFGYGFGITDKLFQLKYFPHLPLEFQGGHTHNSYIEELVNLGFLGAMGFFMLIAYFWGMALNHIYALMKTQQPVAPLYVTLFCVIFAGTISGMFESWFTSVGSVFCFPFWFIGMLLFKLTRLSKAT